MGKHQHNSLRLAVILLFITSIAGCSSSGTLRSDYDPGADFGAYQTWNFMEDAGPDYEGYESLFTQYMLEAITIEMDKRGYVKSENPDLLVNFNAYVQDKTKVTQTSAPPPMMHGVGRLRLWYRNPRVTIYRRHVQHRYHRCEPAPACVGGGGCWPHHGQSTR